MPIIHIDFETYSELNLLEVGPVVYASHHSTRILCMSWRYGLTNRSGLYIPGDTPEPIELFEAIALGYRVEAHNAMFEKCIWRFIGQDRNYWPAVPENNWRCSAAKAAACALPRALESSAWVMKLSAQKDMAGHKTMLRLTKPTRITKKYKGPSAEDYTQLYEYCANDTAVERALSQALPELRASELTIWQTDQRINARGFAVDIEGCKKALAMASTWIGALNTELEALTNGIVKKATQRQALLAWLQDEGVKLINTKALTLDTLLDDDEMWAELDITNIGSAKAKRAIEIMRSIGKSSVSKYQRILETSYQGRVHDTMMYGGATTLRWTGKRVQPHNFPRGKFNSNALMEEAWKAIHSGDTEWIDLRYGDLMHFLSNALKGVIIAPETMDLYGADYNAVETRVLFWLSDEQKGLDVFRFPVKGQDIYTVTATDIYRRLIIKDDEDERQIGKRAALGLGFGMGYIKFLITLRSYAIHLTREQVETIIGKDQLQEISDYIVKKDWQRCEESGMTLEDLPELAFTNFVVRRYRKRYEETVCQLWQRTENCAKAAVEDPGATYEYGKCKWYYDGTRFLTNTLPSGRKLYYPYPEVHQPQRGQRSTRLSFMTTHAKTHQWIEEDTYGGKLVENAVQATARDYMADAIVRCERQGKYEIVLTNHDEMLAQARNGSAEEFAALVSQCEPWAHDLPISAAAWTGKRYRK